MCCDFSAIRSVLFGNRADGITTEHYAPDDRLNTTPHRQRLLALGDVSSDICDDVRVAHDLAYLQKVFRMCTQESM